MSKKRYHHNRHIRCDILSIRFQVLHCKLPYLAYEPLLNHQTKKVQSYWDKWFRQYTTGHSDMRKVNRLAKFVNQLIYMHLFAQHEKKRNCC